MKEHELTYPSRVEGNIGRTLGPGPNGKLWRITAEVYDAAINKTYVTVAEVDHKEVDDLYGVFGGQTARSRRKLRRERRAVA